MAQINTTFSFQDQITQGLTQLNNTLTTLNNNLAAMQGKAASAGDGLDDIGDKAQKAGKKTHTFLEKLFSFNMAKQAFDTVKGAVDSLGRSIDECSNLYNFQLEQETKLETVMRNHMKANEEQIQSIKDLASQQQSIGIFGDEMQLQGAQELATYIDDVETLKGLMPVLNSMLAQGVGMDATSSDMQSYATMIGKVMQGQVGGMMQRGYKFDDEETAILKTGTEMEKLQVLQNAVLGNFGDMNAALRQTPRGQIIALNNDIGDMKEEIGRALVPFQQVFKIATMEWKLKWYKTLTKALESVRKNIKTVVIAVTAGLAAIGVALLAVAGYYAYVKRQAIMSAAAQVAAAAKAAGAWMLAHLPFLLIVAAVIAVIAIIALLLAHSEKTFPVIGGLIGGIGAVAKEVGAQIKYWFGWAIEAVVNGFLKMKDKVSDFFLSMLDLILSGLEKIAPAIDAVFHTDMTENIAGFRTALNALKEAPPPEFSLGWSDNRTPGGVKDAWKRGQRAGETAGVQKSAEFQAWLDKKLAAFNANEMKAANPSEEELADMLKVDSSGALEVKDKGLVDIADDYRELLSKQATERFNLRFAQVTPQVTFGDVSINNDKDGENVLERFVDKMQEAANTYLVK